MNIVCQIIQDALLPRYAQAILANLEERAKLQEQIQMLERHKRTHDTIADSDGDDGS